MKEVIDPVADDYKFSDDGGGEDYEEDGFEEPPEEEKEEEVDSVKLEDVNENDAFDGQGYGNFKISDKMKY